MKQLIIFCLFLILRSTLSKDNEANDQSDLSEDQESLATEEELIENHEVQQSNETANCPDVSHCADTCLIGHEYDENGCMTCECRKRGMVEGDIVIDNEGSYCDLEETYKGKPCKDRFKRGAFGRKWPKVGKHVEVPFVFMPGSFHQRELAIIRSAFQTFHTKTCVRFRPRRTSDRSYLNIFKGNGCYSSIGRSYRPQRLSIGRGCAIKGTVAHELMHALGFYHEQSRPDRDRYVKILNDNIKPRYKRNFDLQSRLNTHGSAYDVGSVMHYPGKAFSKNGRPTIIDKRTNRPIVAQRRDLSAADVAEVNFRFGCNGASSQTCEDSDSRCPGWKRYCTGSKYSRFVKTKCPKLCGEC